MPDIVAEAANPFVRVRLQRAAPVTLHGEVSWRADGNCPFRVTPRGATALFSVYEPIGRTYRREMTADVRFAGEAVPVRLLDDRDPQTGKWIEAMWAAPDGTLRGWYHAEERAPCNPPLFVPHIGEMISEDDGRSWRILGELLRIPAGEIDCSWRNGFFAGGYGDLCVVPDHAAHALMLFFTSYRRDPAAQGISVARLPIETPYAPQGATWWTPAGWRPLGEGSPRPLWPPARGWQHSDPDGFWGPAVHYNRGLGAHVMLLNRTAGGSSDLVQEGIYVSINRRIDDPAAWTEPLPIIKGGAWYPQVIGLEPGCGDAQAEGTARFFMAGFSAWTIRFDEPAAGRPVPNRPWHPTTEDFARTFGAGRRCPW